MSKGCPKLPKQNQMLARGQEKEGERHQKDSNKSQKCSPSTKYMQTPDPLRYVGWLVYIVTRDIWLSYAAIALGGGGREIYGLPIDCQLIAY